MSQDMIIDEIGPLMKVSHVRRETSDSLTIGIDVPVELQQTYRGRAGQFLRILIPGDNPALSRYYSLSSTPELDESLQFTVKCVDGGSVSRRLVLDTRIGDTLHVAPPAGRFTLREDPGPLTLIAGGSGITPIFSILKAALHTTARPIRMLYANRSCESEIFGRELGQLAARHGSRMTLRQHYSDISGFPELDMVRGFVLGGEKSQVYVCGPDPLMEIVDTALCGPEYAASVELIFERFSSPNNSAATTEVVPSGTSALVKVSIDGEEFDYTCSPGETILDAALRAGIPLPFSCKAGHCGACKARMVEGSVLQPTALALSKRDLSRNAVLACCAAPSSPFVSLEYD
jgi:3-ketosteroid 9alpha-monooxygenase subunit B